MQRYATICNGILDMKAALTCNRKVHDINSSLGNTNFENIIYLNWEKKFEEYVAYLGPKNGKKKPNKTKQKSKKIFCTSEQPGTTGRQRRCDPITERMSCLVQNTKAAEIEKTKQNFNLFFDENILNKIADHTKNRIKDTITRLQRVESYSKSISYNKSKDKYTWVKVVDKTKLDPLFG